MRAFRECVFVVNSYVPVFRRRQAMAPPSLRPGGCPRAAGPTRSLVGSLPPSMLLMPPHTSHVPFTMHSRTGLTPRMINAKEAPLMETNQSGAMKTLLVVTAAFGAQNHSALFPPFAPCTQFVLIRCRRSVCWHPRHTCAGPSASAQGVVRRG